MRLGIFLAVCLLGVFALYAVFGQLRFGEKANTYKAEFLNVTGLENGDFVRIAGVEVGKVEERLHPSRIRQRWSSSPPTIRSCSPTAIGR